MILTFAIVYTIAIFCLIVVACKQLDANTQMYKTMDGLNVGIKNLEREDERCREAVMAISLGMRDINKKITDIGDKASADSADNFEEITNLYKQMAKQEQSTNRMLDEAMKTLGYIWLPESTATLPGKWVKEKDSRD